MSALKGKQARFVDEYLVDLNAAGAALRAGYSAKTCEVIGYENLRKPNIAEAIRIAMDKRSEETGITAKYVLEGIKGIIEDAKAENDRSAGLKGYELLGKHLKLFTDKIEQSGTVVLEVVTRVSETED